MFLDGNLAMHIKNLENIYILWLSNSPFRNLEGKYKTDKDLQVYKIMIYEQEGSPHNLIWERKMATQIFDNIEKLNKMMTYK